MNRLAERLRDSIEDEVATGKLLPGTRLDEVDLATRFGVSRTPIREALSLLSGEGFIENRPRRGAVVAQASPHRMVEMFDVMAELEALCGRLAARRISEPELLVLEAAHERCRVAAAAHDTDTYFRDNEDFHRTIYTASHNTFLAEQAQALHRKLRPYRRLQLHVRNRLQRSFEEHQNILDAIRRGDGEAAVTAVREHVIVQGERFVDLLASLQQITQDVPATAAATAPKAE